MIFVDTNYFLRFLLADVEGQHREVKKLFQDSLSGKIKLFTSIIVFFEIYWVLSSFYKKRKSKIAVVLDNILKMSFIYLEERDLLQKTVRLFAKSKLDLEDSYNLVYAKMNQASKFASFDQKLIKAFAHLSKIVPFSRE